MNLDLTSLFRRHKNPPMELATFGEINMVVFDAAIISKALLKGIQARVLEEGYPLHPGDIMFEWRTEYYDNRRCLERWMNPADYGYTETPLLPALEYVGNCFQPLREVLTGNLGLVINTYAHALLDDREHPVQYKTDFGIVPIFSDVTDRDIASLLFPRILTGMDIEDVRDRFK